MQEPSNDNNPGLAHKFARAAGTGLKYTLKAVGIYLWPIAARWDRPFSRQGAVKKTRRFLRGTGALALVLAGHQVLHTGTGMLFPTGEDYMQSQGLDPALARQLSDNTIRVRQRDFWGTLHAANDLPTIFGLATTITMMSIPGQAYAIPGHNGTGALLRHTPLGQYLHCSVMLQDDVTARETVATLAGVSPHQIENIKISDHESRLAVAFHEFRHCDSDNAANEGLAEGDADARGILLLAETLKNPEIARTMLYARALSQRAHSHDTALYLDAAMRGEPLPADIEETAQPTSDAFALADIYMRSAMADDPRSTPVKTAVALRAIIARYGELLSPAAQRRAELYIEAVAYFMPRALAAAPPVPGPALGGPR